MISIQVNKLQKTSHDKGMQAEKAREAYKTTLDTYNGKQTLYFEVDVNNLVNKDIQGPEEKRLQLLSGYWTEYADIQKRSGEAALGVFDGIVEAAKSCDPARDSLALIERNKSGMLHPGDLPFEEYGVPNRTLSNGTKPSKHRKTSKAVGGRPKSMEINDFSYLPPTQRHERITEMIASLNKQLGDLEKAEGSVKKSEKAAHAEEMEHVKQLMNQYQTLLTNIDSATGSEAAELSSPTTSTTSAIENEDDTVDLPVPPAIEEVYEIPEPPTGPPLPENPAEGGAAPPPPPPPPPPPGGVVVTDIDVVEYDVIYEFGKVGKQDFELSISVGDVVTEVDSDDGSGWSKVKKGQAVGYVPTSYIQKR